MFLRLRNCSFPKLAMPAAILCLSLTGPRQSSAQRAGGAFAILPWGSPEMALEPTTDRPEAGSAVSIGVPNGTEKQRWAFVSKGGGWYAIQPASGGRLVLSVAGNQIDNGTPVVLETDAGKPSQLWAVKRNENGSLSFLSKLAPNKGLDDFGGNKKPGARQDLWSYSPGDLHLHWTVKPFDGGKLPEFQSPSATELAAGPAIPGVPQGMVKEFTFTESAIFPGTKRSCAVFIPAQYDGSKPACVYVRQDGYNPKEKSLLEALIAAKEMPVTVGVFVRPGELAAAAPGTHGRRNRCFEYDAMNDNYVRFLVEELLPYVAKAFNLRLSQNGNDRCIAGASSGGICAFNAAWLRPDAFSRVYANSGSFVAFRGGHEFPTLIRKFEPRPIRAYLTTATHDMENCAGDWYLLDQEMDKALAFSSYDYVFTVLQGKHCAGWNDLFPEAMKFIWRGWPEPVHPGPGAPRFRDIAETGAGWELVSALHDARGPACNSKGEIFFAGVADNKIYRIGLDGKVAVFLQDAAHANAVAVGANDELFTVSAVTGNVMRYDSNGQGVVLARGIAGLHALAMPDGSLYVSATNRGDGEPAKLWLLKDGKQIAMDAGAKLPTGLAMRPDRWLLSVADGHSKWVYSCQVQPDGTLVNRERFFWLHVPDWEDDAGAESVCYAREGQMLVATRFGVQVCADDGPCQVILPLPETARAVGICFGGRDLDTLYAFSESKIWKRHLKVHGAGAFTPRVAIKPTPL